MTIDYILGGGVTLFLLAYLTYALVRPERYTYDSQRLDTDSRLLRDHHLTCETAWRLHDACF